MNLSDILVSLEFLCLWDSGGQTETLNRDNSHTERVREKEREREREREREEKRQREIERRLLNKV